MNKVQRSAMGFTLVEVLVTLSIFSLAVLVLVAGLRQGTRTYTSVLHHQQARAADNVYLEQLRQDVRHIAVVAENKPALTESQVSTGGETLAFTSLVPEERLRAGLGGVWRTITYVVGEDEDGAEGLLRGESNFVADNVSIGEPEPGRLIVPGASSATFEYIDKGATVPTWTEADRLPAAVVVTIEREGAPTLKTTAWLPGAMLGEGS